ncbi:MAG: CBS domain-containing protein [Candidatus Anstonellales archaeon]
MFFPELDQIKNLRKKLNLTQKQLAKIANVSQATIAKIEKGKLIPSYSVAVSIFSALLNYSKSQNKQNKMLEIVAKDIMSENVIYANPDDDIHNCIEKMIKNNISQLPVIDSKGFILGSITEENVLDFISNSNKINKQKITAIDICDEIFPIILETTNLNAIIELLKKHKALLVSKKGKIVGIITKSDIFKAKIQ